MFKTQTLATIFSLFLLGIVLIVILLTTEMPVSAQETQDLTTLQTNYRQLLDEYRKQEEQFSISATQYYQLKTLASQEDAVQKMREVMLTRADVLITYFTILQTEMDQQPGIELSRKAIVDTKISTALDSLRQHRNRVDVATDRISVDQEAAYLEAQGKNLIAVSSQTQALLKIGAVQNALDHLVITKQKADTYIASANVSETVRLEKQRGSDELGRTTTSITQSIADTMTSYDREAQNSNNQQIGDTISSQLAGAYSSLNTGLTFLKELLKI